MIRALALLAFLAGCASIEQKACFTPAWEWATYLERIERQIPGAVWVELTESERGRFMADMNKTDRPTGIMYDRVGYFRHRDSNHVMLVFIVGDCVWVDAIGIESIIKWVVRPRETGA